MKYYVQFIIFTTMLGIVITLLNFDNLKDGYKEIIYLPPAFLICFIIIVITNTLNNFKFTVLGYTTFQWLRNVVMIILISMSNRDFGTSYIPKTIESLKFASSLMLYELIVTSFLLIILTKVFNAKKKVTSRKLTLTGNKLIYSIYSLISMGILIFIAFPQDIIRFIYISADGKTGERAGDATSGFEIIVQQIVVVGAIVIFILVADYMSKKFYKFNSLNYYYITLSVALFNICLIVGERRTAQIYMMFLTIYILTILFPMYKRKTIIYIFGTSLLVVGMMSIYKFFGVFTTGSYTTAISQANTDSAYWAKMFQSYFFGPENIAGVILFSESIRLNQSHMIFDFLRSTFGISFFLKDNGYLTSQLYNLYLYEGQQLSGHVISSIAYGYIYLGYFFAPLFASINIFLSITFENFMNRTRSIEFKILFLYILLRFCTNLFVNTAPLISLTTIFMGTAGLLFLFANVFTAKSKGV